MISQATYNARFNAILERITATPACHDQANWHCGTAHCFAGHAQLDSGKKADKDMARKDARIWLGITSVAAANYLFSSYRTLVDFEKYRDGYNFDGYADDGYDDNGYDRDGYARNGYALNGYDREGYKFDGYNFDGYDRDGYDRDGYNFDGYDDDGYDRDGYDRDGLNAQLEVKPE